MTSPSMITGPILLRVVHPPQIIAQITISMIRGLFIEVPPQLAY